MCTDKPLFYLTSFIIAVGIVFALSLPVFTVLYFDFSPYHFFIRQLGVGLVGILIMWSLSQLDPDRVIVGRLTTFEVIGFCLFFGSFLLIMVMQLLPASLVPLTGGAKRWIRLGPLSLSPVEFFKVGFVFFLAWSFNRKISRDKKKLKEEFWLLLPYFLVLAVATFFILVLQKDLGQVVVLAVTLMVLGTFAGTSKRFFAILSGVGVLLLIAAIITQPHRIRRFQSWWVTNQDAILKMLPSEWAQQLYITGAEEPYQITHSLNAIYHGGFFGTGLGGGTFKLGFLSEVHTDFVLAGIAEEIGFIGLIGVSAILLFIIFRILKISSRSFNNNVYHLFSLGIAVIITVAFLMNAYGITSLIPIKGIAVPFLSYGGSSVLALSIAVGMVLMVSKKVDLS
ncbi:MULTISPECIES: FtsW/RodA/SpoVE family cell cycle protein [Campylobacter]|uniref:Probable peptidoglycan glycosyltransferase FtsW n=1 Tax=Campylobacter magnus TaxID=3026462 RepID=A0ABT8T540_9BACT|nr:MULTISPECIES: FtsW/RodA/SpoVE family cell cycle protein [Campylobacter]MCI7246413.1 FtsW/RodA/SpoVE family cell cycle protein [Campylobacter sp.]MCI7447048.1 FtsW/RodA/SpoVE family cell cycle protein [Campylobacter sp.]MDD0847827.1 FtsW/RodA/SpoVE family cell cycle protein [Campylobacter magnus]MDD0854991.1 FtsW/RodA/SpoVE family cell cycle protein [Campylobacter magnus]MDO2407652.1 FtsW/RodA/SpoVE family cell cycle protein [Campylobacter magnus]